MKTMKRNLFTTALLAIALMMITTNAFAGGATDVLQQVQDALQEVPGMGGYESATGFSFSEAQERADMIGGKDIPMAGPANPTPTPTLSKTIEDAKWAGALVVIQDRNNNPEQRWWIVNSGRGFHFLVNAKNDNAYRIEDRDGSEFITGESNLLYGWFRFIGQ